MPASLNWTNDRVQSTAEPDELVTTGFVIKVIVTRKVLPVEVKIKTAQELVKDLERVETLALIDTGARKSTIPKQLLSGIGVQPTGNKTTLIGVGNVGQVVDLYDVTIWLPNNQYRVLEVTGASGAGVDILLGRDFLKDASSFTYKGKTGEIELIL